MLVLKDKAGAKLARLAEAKIDELTRLGFLISDKCSVTLSAGRGSEREWNTDERMKQNDWVMKLQDEFGLKVEDQRQTNLKK